MDAPLTGVRVVETAGYVSGPFAGMMLADLGAEVVKVEPPRGEPARRFGLRYRGVSALGLNVNHGKDCVELDLKSDGGRARLRDLLAAADVFLQNWRPGVAESLGFGADEVCAAHPRLVYATVSGFGPEGPRATAPVFDSLLQATSGIAAYEAIDGRPTIVRSYLADKTTATFAAQAVLAALLARERTGRGTRVEVSMLDVMGYFDFPDVGQDRTFLGPGAEVDLAPGRTPLVRTSDGWIAVAPVRGAQLAAAVAAVGHPEWVENLKRAPNPTALTEELYRLLETVTRDLTTAECERRFVNADVPVAPVLTVDQHLADPQTVSNDLYVVVDGPVGPMRRVRHPARVDGERLPLSRTAAPPAGTGA